MSDTNWNGSGNWDTGLVPSGITDDVIIGSPSPTTLNINVNLNSLMVGADGVVNFNSSRNLDFGGTATTTLMNLGTINVANNSDLQLQGMAINSGTINVETLGNPTDLEVDGSTVLTGGGTVNLFGPSTISRIVGVNEPVLTIANHTIQGTGNIGFNTLSVTLSADSTIDANVTDQVLFVDPNTNGFTNNGMMQASGGGVLTLTGFGGGTYDNENGTIRALASSEVRIDNEAAINGGTIATLDDGLISIPISRNVFLSDLNLDANVVINNNSDFGVEGTITNTGTITAFSGGNPTGIEVQADGATFNGGGTIVLANNSTQARIDGVDNPSLNIGNQTIQGLGNIGFNTLSVTLSADSTIDANVTDQVLFVDPNTNGFTNNGMMQASGGGVLTLTGFGGGTYDNENGTIRALASSEVRIDNEAAINGGTIATLDDGLISIPISRNVFLSDLNLDANVVINNNSDFGVEGTITNTGTITAFSGGNPTGIEVQADGATFNGGGTIVLANSTQARIDGFAPIVIEGGTLTGIGGVFVESTFDGGTVAAGASIGTLTFNSPTRFLNDTTIEFELSSANATPGTTSDRILINSELNLDDPTLDSGLEIQMATLDGNGDPGPLADFDPNDSYSFVVAIADQINGFSASDVSIDTSEFQNSFTGVFSVTIGPFGSDQAIYVKYGQFALGDINQDGSVNLLDVAPFVDAISNGTPTNEGDFNCDGTVNLLDVGPFVSLLAG